MVIRGEEKCCAICGAKGKLVNDHCHDRKLAGDFVIREFHQADHLIDFEERFEPKEE